MLAKTSVSCCLWGHILIPFLERSKCLHNVSLAALVANHHQLNGPKPLWSFWIFFCWHVLTFRCKKPQQGNELWVVKLILVFSLRLYFYFCLLFCCSEGLGSIVYRLSLPLSCAQNVTNKHVGTQGSDQFHPGEYLYRGTAPQCALFS